MIVALLLSDGIIHIINFKHHKGYRSYCNTDIIFNLKINSLSFDNTFPGICKNCKNIFDQMYQQDLNKNTASVRNGFQMKFIDLSDLHRYEIIGPKIKYENIMNRYWKFLNDKKRYKNKYSKFKI